MINSTINHKINTWNDQDHFNEKNNFRFDAGFQILVGSWINPAEHEYYANGNVLSWAELLPYR